VSLPDGSVFSPFLYNSYNSLGSGTDKFVPLAAWTHDIPYKVGVGIILSEALAAFNRGKYILKYKVKTSHYLTNNLSSVLVKSQC
jgi:hypothetical protein